MNESNLNNITFIDVMNIIKSKKVTPEVKFIMQNTDFIYLLSIMLFSQKYLSHVSFDEILDVVNELRECKENIDKKALFIFLNFYKHEKIKKYFYEKHNDEDIRIYYIKTIDYLAAKYLEDDNFDTTMVH